MHLGIHPQHPPLAPGHGFAASSVSYGVAVPGACPIVGSFGGKNRNLRGAAQKLDRALEALGVDHDVKEYPDAGAYLPQRPPRGGRLERPVHGDRTSPVMAGYVGGYHEPSARDARRRIPSFFDRHLKSVT